MPPPWSTNPAPRTESAREARKAFYCELCQKGYSRINEFEAHEGSYDHQHKKRLKDLRHISRDPTATARARRAEEKQVAADLTLASTGAKGSGGFGIKPISLSSNTGEVKSGGGGFKKGGFKSAFAPVASPAVEQNDTSGKGGPADGNAALNHSARASGDQNVSTAVEEHDDTTTKWGDYDPRRPTGCSKGCPGWVETDATGFAAVPGR